MLIVYKGMREGFIRMQFVSDRAASIADCVLFGPCNEVLFATYMLMKIARSSG